MKVAIVGFDVEGRASFEYFNNRGDDITICDIKTDVDVPAGAAAQLGENYLTDLDRFDLIMRTAGLPPSKILEVNPGVAPKVTTQVQEFLRVCPTKQVIGVTGTKGKGTTSTLISEMLKANDKPVFLGGNIGIAPFTFLADVTSESWVVLELSSFQLIDLQVSPHIGVCLMVVPEHLNWHQDMDEYAMAKAQMFAHQTADDVAIYFAESDLSKQIASAGDGQKIPYFAAPGAVVVEGSIKIGDQPIAKTDEVKLLGAHNLQNVCAAVTTVWQAGCRDIPAMQSVLSSFAGLEHRLEFVRELGGVQYYDDSFGTAPETAIVALQAFEQPKVIILGGSDKGADYEFLARAVASGNVRKVVLIGEQAARIQTALKAAGYLSFIPGGGTMAEIVATARAAAQTGDVVLLSTACASFDMFANYKDRGNQFKQAVAELS